MKNILIVLIISFFLSGITVFGQATKIKSKPKTASKDATLQNELNNRNSEIKKLKKEAETFKSQIKERDETIENLKDGKKDLSKNLTVVKESTNTIKERYDELNTKYDSVSNANSELITENKNYMYATIGLAILSALFLVLWLISRKKNNKVDDGLLDIFKEQFKDIDALKNYFSDKTNEKFDKNDIIDFLGKIRQVIQESDVSAKQTNNWQKITDFAKVNVKDLKNENEIMPLLEKALLDLSGQKLVQDQKTELAKTNDNFSISKSIYHPEPSGATFYFNNPTKSGFFNDEQRSVNRTSETLFEFILNNTNPSEASYFISASPDAIPSALNFHDYRIEPVCDCENVYETNHKNIINKGAGKARLEDGKWIIKQAAKVRYV